MRPARWATDKLITIVEYYKSVRRVSGGKEDDAHLGGVRYGSLWTATLGAAVKKYEDDQG